METRNIINCHGTVIGQLSMDDGTTEDQWAAALADKLSGMTADKIRQNQSKYSSLLVELYRDNSLAGITVAQSDQVFEQFADVILRIREGAPKTAVYRLQQKTPSGFVTQDLIDSWISKIQTFTEPQE